MMWSRAPDFASARSCSISGLRPPAPATARSQDAMASFFRPKAMKAQPLQPKTRTWSGDVRKTWADIEAAKVALGYSPSISIEAGIARFVNWIGERR